MRRSQGFNQISWDESPESNKKYFPLNYRNCLTGQREQETILEVENDHESHSSFRQANKKCDDQDF